MPRDGLLYLLKPPGMSSHQVVGFARRVLGQRRIGHLGTLDPGAAGVLVLAVGRATALAAYGLEADKGYRAEIVLGRSTDTQDAYGRIMDETETVLPLARVREGLGAFIGESWQLPPMASAKRVDGERLYVHARAGREIERQPSRITIRRLELQAVAHSGAGFGPIADEMMVRTPGARLLVDIRCSKGTYVRTLCHDLDRRLGCGAHMGFLLRTEAPPGKLAITWPLERFAAEPDEALQPMWQLVAHLPEVRLSDAKLRRLAHGAAITVPHDLSAGRVRIHAESGQFAAIARGVPEDGGVRLQPERVLISPAELKG